MSMNIEYYPLRFRYATKPTAYIIEGVNGNLSKTKNTFVNINDKQQEY